MSAESVASHPPRIKRGIVIIKKGLQAKFIAIVLVSVILSISLILGDLYYTFGRDVVADLMDPGLYELFVQINKVLVAKLLIYLVVVAVVTVFMSHKLVGPIYRFEKSTEVVAGGDLTYRVKLRKGDELLELQDSFNKMVESLQARVAKDREIAQKIASQVDAVGGARAADIKADLARLTQDFKI